MDLGSGIRLRQAWERLSASPVGYRLARGAFWSLGGALVSRGLGLIAAVVVARLLGPQQFGELGIIQSTVGLFGTVAGFGLGLTGNKHVAEFRRADPAKAGRIIAASSLFSWITGGVVTALFVTFAASLAASVLAAPQLTRLLQFSGLLVFLGAINGAQTGALAGFEAFKSLARVSLMSGLLSFPVTVLFAVSWGLPGAVWALIVVQTIGCVLNHLALRREAKKNCVPVGYRGCLSEASLLWNFSLPALLGSAVTTPALWAANALLVNQPGGYLSMGVYNAVSRIKQVPELVLSVLVAPLIPVLSERRAVGDARGYGRATTTAFILSSLVVAPVILLQIAFPTLTYLPYGEAFQGAPALVQWLMFHGLLAGVFFPLGAVLTSQSRMWLNFVLNAAFSMIFVVLSWQLVPERGAIGLGTALAAAYGLTLLPAVVSAIRGSRGLLEMGPLLLLAGVLLAVAGLCALATVFSSLAAQAVAWLVSVGVLAALLRRMAKNVVSSA